MKLTNYLRNKIVNKLLEKRVKEFEVYKKQLSEKVIAEYKKSVPVDLMSCFKKHRSYFSTFHFYSNSLSFSDNNLPMPYESYLNQEATFFSKTLKQELITYEKKVKESKEFRKKLEGIIQNYTSSTKVLNDFPECKSLFDEKLPNLNLPAIPIKEIRLELGYKS